MSLEKQAKDFEQKPIRSLFKWAGILSAVCLIPVGVNMLLKPAKMEMEHQAVIHSHQYKESMSQRAAILEANIIQVEEDLRLDPENIALQSQLKALKAQYRATLR